MQHLFQAWESFSADIRTASHVLLLSDYDGTLTPIVSRPDLAVLSPETRDILVELTARPACSVGIVSGRSLSEIKAMVAIDSIYYAGNHGLEIEGPGLRFINPAATATRTKIKDLSRQLSAELNDIEGILVEDKGLSLSVHYRLVKADDEKTVADIVQRITSPWLNQEVISVTAGKKVWEVKPHIDWHKGKALETITQEIVKTLQPTRLSTIYLGDDTTDEDAFRITYRPQGWGIFVGGENPASSAEYFLNTTTEVETFLSRLLGL